MRKKSPIDEELVRIVEPVLEKMGLELVELELKREAGGRVLRIFVDSPVGVDVDTCADASNAIGAALDRRDPIEGAYSLEVSSPGIERPLTKPEHFARSKGEKAKVKTAEPIGGRRDFTGVIVDADDEGFVIEVDGTETRVEYDKVVKARLKPQIKF